MSIEPSTAMYIHNIHTHFLFFRDKRKNTIDN